GAHRLHAVARVRAAAPVGTGQNGDPMTATAPPPAPRSAVAERVAEIIAGLPRTTPAATEAVCKSLLIDVAGLCIAARDADYMLAMLAATDEPGDCTVIGHAITRSAGM